MKSDRENALSAKTSVNPNSHQRQPITLYMIALELENDLMKLRSRFVKVITKVFGINRK